MLQNAGTEVVEAKAGAGSATLSMAYAAYLFVTSCLKAMNGYAGIVECCYVEDDSVEGCDFFAQRVKLGKQGVITRLDSLSLSLSLSRYYLLFLGAHRRSKSLI